MRSSDSHTSPPPQLDISTDEAQIAVFRHCLVTKLSVLAFCALRDGVSVIDPDRQLRMCKSNAAQGALEMVMRLGLCASFEPMSTEWAEVERRIDSNELGLEPGELCRLESWVDQALRGVGLALDLRRYEGGPSPQALEHSTWAIALLATTVFSHLAAGVELVHELPPDDPADAEGLVGDASRLCLDAIRATWRRGVEGFNSQSDAAWYVCDYIRYASSSLKGVTGLVVEHALADLEMNAAYASL